MTTCPMCGKEKDKIVMRRTYKYYEVILDYFGNIFVKLVGYV